MGLSSSWCLGSPWEQREEVKVLVSPSYATVTRTPPPSPPKVQVARRNTRLSSQALARLWLHLNNWSNYIDTWSLNCVFTLQVFSDLTWIWDHFDTVKTWHYYLSVTFLPTQSLPGKLLLIFQDSAQMSPVLWVFIILLIPDNVAALQVRYTSCIL